MEEVIAAHESAKKEEPLLLRLDRPVRYWSEGAVIGSCEFVERLSDQIYGEGKKRRFAEGQVSKGESLFFCVGCVCSGHPEQSGRQTHRWL